MKLRLAILSDLHSRSKSRKDPSSGARDEENISYLPAYPGPSDHKPFDDLDKLIQDEALSADLLLCPGDICDKGDIKGFTYAWEQLHKLKGKLKVQKLLATCGNHDLNSRYSSEFGDDDPDPKGNLLQLTPPFPFGDSPETNTYWAQNFVIIDPISNVRVIALNTSAYHGGKNGELEHGRVSMRTIEAIAQQITKLEPKSLNILLCHHHLQPLSSHRSSGGDLEHVHKGQDLLEKLTKTTHTAWLVVHGHRHLPNISHSSSPPVTIFGAASFSRMGDTFTNQFHLVDIEVDPMSMTMPLCGAVQTWNWSRANGWGVYLDPSKGLPPRCGFGYSGSPQALIPLLNNFLADQPFVDWNNVISAIPALQYLTPDQWTALNTHLVNNKLVITAVSGIPSQLGRKT